MTQITWPGAEGIPQLPFKRLFTPVKRTPRDGAQIVTAYTDGQVTLRSNRAKIGYHEAADTSTYLGVRKGDFVVHGLDIMRGSVGVSDSDGVISPVCTVCIPTPLIEPRYAAYAMRLQAASDFPRALARGVREGGADFRRWDTLAELPLPVPPLEEQRAIADYLDRETAQIDEFTAKNEELIVLLTERRATVIDRSVFGFRGESGSVARRVPDFVEELAALRDFVKRTPIDWDVARFKSVTRRRVIRNVDGSATMRSLKTTGEVVRRTSQQSPDDSSIPRYLLVEPDDLVVNPMWLVGGAIGVSTRHGAVSPDYRVFRPRTELAPRFLHHLLRSRPYRAQYELFTRAETTFDRRVNQRDLDRLPIPIPPLDEQISIATAIDRELDRIDDTAEAAKRSIELARERRAALISAAVAGKIDVGVTV